MKQKNKVKKGNFAIGTIIGISFVIFFIVSLVAMVNFSKRKPLMCAFILGLYFLVLGLISVGSVLKENSHKKDLLVFLFPIIGLGIIIYTSILMWGYKFNISISERTTAVLLLVIFILAGSGMVLSPIIKSKNKKQKYDMVHATCIELQKRYSQSSNGSSRIVYAPMYSYYYNGKEYKIQSNIYSNIDVPDVGAIQDIYVNPDYPDEIYRFSLKQNISAISIGIIFIVSAVVSLFLYLK